jgi:regulator of sigma E protease
MEILIFIVGIIILIVVHELGHFIAAKLSGMRVDEFGLGYPPRAAILGKIGETILSLNWLPFGGFVKIYGEDIETGGAKGDIPSKARDAFTSKNRFLQVIVLVAGVAMNLIFAYILITSALIAGTPRALSPNEIAGAKNVELAIADVLPNTPAANAGLLAGDSILSAKDTEGSWSATDPSSFSEFVAASHGETITLEIKRDGNEQTITATPVAGVAPIDPTRYALGVEVTTIGVIPVSFLEAIKEGTSLTWDTTTIIAVGIWHFFYGIFTLRADLSQVAGPVGIVNAVGATSSQGFGNLLSLMAVISINLALINLIPIPALDGGRILFVIIESVIRRPIKPSIAQVVNSIGFAFLVLLMVVITAHDIFKIVG